MRIGDSYIRCPKCDWEPDESCRWMCDVCKTSWNTFETHGQCPGCKKIFVDTMCSERRGGCGQMSPHEDWYGELEKSNQTSERSGFFGFWKNKNELPITENDRQWVEEGLLWLTETFLPEFCRSLVTITPEKQYFDHHFTGIEEDVDFILETVASIMGIKLWEIQLMFFSNKPTVFSEGISTTPSEKLKNRWTSKESELVDKGFGSKEIWIELEQMNDPVGLIATISTELAKYKLKDEYGMEEHIDVMADLTSIIFGFGIFKGNSYFKFAQWHGNTHHGWRMKKRGGLPEQIIAYAMAWLAYYRNEDPSWKKYLNRTVKKYFEQCYKYIQERKS